MRSISAMRVREFAIGASAAAGTMAGAQLNVDLLLEDAAARRGRLD
ncbi:MAG: hypothetical protein J0H23_04020 [Micrococcales bacterium]|nr:hypothetical protein [Micrococcales bacterium]